MITTLDWNQVTATICHIVDAELCGYSLEGPKSGVFCETFSENNQNVDKLSCVDVLVKLASGI